MLIVEALAGALTGAGTVRANPDHDDQGVLVIALDVKALRPLDDFTREVEDFLGYVREVPLEPGASEVRMPGESGAASTRHRAEHGVPVQDSTWQRLAELGHSYGVQLPSAT